MAANEENLEQVSEETETEAPAQNEEVETEESEAPEQVQPAPDLTHVPEKFLVRDASGNVDAASTLAKLATSYTNLEKMSSAQQQKTANILRALAQQPQVTPAQPASVEAPSVATLRALQAVASDPTLSEDAKAVKRLELMREYMVGGGQAATPQMPTKHLAAIEYERMHIAGAVPYYAENRDEVDNIIDVLEREQALNPLAKEESKIALAISYHMAAVQAAQKKGQQAVRTAEEQVADALKSKGVTATGTRRGASGKTASKSEADRIKDSIKNAPLF